MVTSSLLSGMPFGSVPTNVHVAGVPHGPDITDVKVAAFKLQLNEKIKSGVNNFFMPEGFGSKIGFLGLNRVLIGTTFIDTFAYSWLYSN